MARAYTPTALPSTTARLLAFVAILLGGLCGALIGYSVADLQCGTETRPAARSAQEDDPDDADDGGCGAVLGIGAFGGAVAGAGGVAVISVLVLRAMAEWRRELDSA